MDRRTMLWLGIAAIVTAAVVVAFAGRRSAEDTIVLGREVAAARGNEAARLASGSDGPSPMPKGDYDQEKGDHDLTSVIEGPLDVELTALVRTFGTWAPEKRAEARRRISMDELYTLVHFAKRSSVLALREKSIARCEDGLLALAMIDEARIDPRDAAWAAGLLGHAMEATGADRRVLVKDAAALATPGMSTLLADAAQGSRLSDWGYAQIRADKGIGLVRSGSERYEPTGDLTGLALRLAAVLGRGRYVAEPEIATDLPEVWFQKQHRPSAERLLKTARGVVLVRGTVRRAHTDNPRAQMLVQWVAEMPSPEDANTLVEYAGANRSTGSHFVTGMARGRLFALLVAGSSFEGVEPFESAESFAAIAAETRPLLDELAR
jgi:hypothetical protein